MVVGTLAREVASPVLSINKATRHNCEEQQPSSTAPI